MRLRERSPGLWKQRGYIGIGNRRGMGGMTFRERIAALMNGSEFFAPLTHSAVPTRAASGTTGTFTRTTTETWPNNDGYMVTGVAGEIGFVGARRVRNFVPNSETLTAAAGWGLSNITTPGSATATAPDGTTTAWILTASTATAQWYKQITGLLPSGSGLSHIWLRRNTGTGTVGLFTSTGAFAGDLAITSTWTQYSLKTTTTAGGTSYVGIQITTSGDKVEVWHPQFEDVTAQTTQTAGEYVSVGVGDIAVPLGNTDFSLGQTVWTFETGATVSGGKLQINSSSGPNVYQLVGRVGVGCEITVVVDSISGGNIYVKAGAIPGTAISSAGTYTYVASTNPASALVGIVAQTGVTVVATISRITARWLDHGSGVDGVKCFNTDLSGNPLPTQYTYDAVSLNGVAGTYVSTPDSVAASITGDINIRVKARLADWVAPAAHNMLVSKLLTAGQYSYDWYVQTGSNFMMFRHSTDGTAVVSSPATAAVSFTDGDTGWVRVTRVSSTGIVTFYTSSDGVTWTQLGNTVASASGAIFDGNTALSVGANATGASPLSGRIYQAQIYNGINGTLAVDFDASRYAGGTTLTGSTGETWTLNGNAVIHPTNSPMLGYQAEGARTNLCLQSNDFSNASWVKVLTPSETQNVVGPDGATSAWTLTDNSAVALEYIRQTSSALTAANYTFSVFIKKTTGAQTAYPVVQVTTGATGALCTVDTTNGVATVWTAYTGLTIVTSSASCVSHNSDYWRVSLVFLGVAATHDLYLFPACTTNATQSTGTFDVAAQASHVFYGAQVELGSFASSYIATTTLAVARNKDEESVSTSGNIEAAAGSVYLEYTPTHTPSGTVAFWGTYVDANNYTAILHDATNLIFRKRIAGVDYDATIVNAFVAGTTYKACATWGTTGTSITLNGTEGTPHANTTAAKIAATMQWGADGNSAQQPFASIRNCRDWTRHLSASERAAITS